MCIGARGQRTAMFPCPMQPLLSCAATGLLIETPCFSSRHLGVTARGRKRAQHPWPKAVFKARSTPLSSTPASARRASPSIPCVIPLPLIYSKPVSTCGSSQGTWAILSLKLTFRTIHSADEVISRGADFLDKTNSIWYPKLDECGCQQPQFESAQRIRASD